MRDDSLLKLEKKLDTFSTKDILLSKFVLKPKIDKSEIMQGKDFLKNISGFINDFKKQNSELLNDENKAKELNIEEGAELAKNNSKKKPTKIKKSKKTNKKKANGNNNNNIQINNINTEEEKMIEEIVNKKEAKFIELNLKLGVLDLVKKEENKKKVLIEEVIPEENKNKDNLKENKESDSDSSSESSVTYEDLNIIRVGQNNKNNNFNSGSKGRNYLDVLKRNDNILQGIIKNKSNDLVRDGDKGPEEYPFLDLKNDTFNKEVLNFLMENSRNKANEEVVRKKSKRVLSARNNNKISKNEYEINNNYNQ